MVLEDLAELEDDDPGGEPGGNPQA
jgi:hypothetical protein